ncbi:MAG TPA: Na(+)/H(+) antiporter subunit B [Aliicoccus persicus]|uniref:Na(+)/H(+) antiporter subunit B n=1 Tax=Aliicoccus persicus TaxID=930138 RepID=A0A921JD09_9STAP|nr:Na(+)/H(+) antiporter subunit B [Aliicoccus persicus]
MKSALMRAGYKKVSRQMNDVFLQFASKVIFFLIVMFAFNLFFAGHYTPGGGFVGGLLGAAAVVLLLIAFDRKTVHKMMPINYRFMITLGLVFAGGVPTISYLFGTPFFQHQFTYIELPILQEISIHTAVFFDIGVFLAVMGACLLIITLVAEEKA